MGDQWSYKPNDDYKSPRQLIHLLVDVVSKGGNLLLNVGPDADGRFPEPAVARLEAIGDWMDVCAEAIHGTRPIAPYKEGRVCLTRKKDGTVYALILAKEGETAPPASVTLSSPRPKEGSTVRMLGAADPVAWTAGPDGVTFTLPERARRSPPCEHAWVLRFAPAGE
jgi:alpha-L-fucosidase